MKPDAEALAAASPDCRQQCAVDRQTEGKHETEAAGRSLEPRLCVSQVRALVRAQPLLAVCSNCSHKPPGFQQARRHFRDNRQGCDRARRSVLSGNCMAH